MKAAHLILCSCLAVALSASAPARADTPNKMLGTWRMASAHIERNGALTPAYGLKPMGMLVFTADMHYVEVLTDSSISRFASDTRGMGTADENKAAMAGSIGFFGAYTVDERGDFNGNRVDASTFPNWVGNTRTRKELSLVVEGDRMTENFQRPEGTRIVIVWQRVRGAGD
ncbi:MAG: hypothetical protein GAK35_02507 [Herbaspirillum frisingense]|uniref:Lipocalin-like domain-containing protein n=1 Tax=Herbaspirillum frisingense TaxID=92645 RepID=A0A7V8JU51_9BURK|nr:MAG: hypothetical protein GAK35_02507 [Herbaspirillum frisingense]